MMFVVDKNTGRAILCEDSSEWKDNFPPLPAQKQGKHLDRVGEFRWRCKDCTTRGDGEWRAAPLQMILCRLSDHSHAVGCFFGADGTSMNPPSYEKLPDLVRISIIPHFSATMMSAIFNELAGAWRFDRPLLERYYKDLAISRDASQEPGKSVSTSDSTKTAEEREANENAERSKAPGTLSEDDQIIRERFLAKNKETVLKQLRAQVQANNPSEGTRTIMHSDAVALSEARTELPRAQILSIWQRAVRATLDEESRSRPHEPSAFPPALQPTADRHQKELCFLDARTATEVRGQALKTLPDVWGSPDRWTDVETFGRRWLVLCFFLAQVNPYYTRVLLGLHDSLSPLDAHIINSGTPLPSFAHWTSDESGRQMSKSMATGVHFWHACASSDLTVAFMLNRYQTCSYDDFYFLCFNIWGNFEHTPTMPESNCASGRGHRTLCAYTPCPPTRSPRTVPFSQRCRTSPRGFSTTNT